MEPEEPDLVKGRIPTAHWWIVAISLAVPGMAAAGLIYLSWSFSFRIPTATDPALVWALFGGFVLLALGCCIFAAGVLTHDAPVVRRHLLWVEWSFIFSFLQLALTPAVALVILLPFMV